MPTIFEQQDRAVIGGSVGNEESAEDGGSQTNEKALLIENMELVEPKKTIHVPNHLLETKTYAKLSQNGSVHSRPSVIHFEGFEIGEKQCKRLTLLNASSDVLRMHIIPPQTRNFYIKYTKPARMVAGMTLDCTVEFTPDEWRYYYDCIRIHCPGEENLVIPIHGYPIMSTKDFPRNYTFSPIPVGHRSSKTFPLKCMAPIDFEFHIKYVQPHPAFLIEPLSGIVPANGQAEVTVIFAPFEFQTATMKIELSISQFNSKGILCTFIGSSQPGLLKTKTMTSTQSEILDPRCVSPLDRARLNRRKNKVLQRGGEGKSSSAPSKSMVLEKDGIRFPADLNNPHAVGKVLTQEPGKLKVNEMRQNMLAKKASKESSRQMKEAVFESAVRQNVYEERQNQLRWQVKIGEDPISGQERYNILEERNAAVKHYMFKRRGDPIPEDEYNREKTDVTYRRTMRDAGQLASEEAMFDTYSNDMWAVRHAALDRFIQAARTIIIRNRAVKKLRGLKNYMVDWGKKKSTGLDGGDSRSVVEEQEAKEVSVVLTGFRAEKVHRHKFPTYVTPNVKDDMAPDALGNVPFKPTEIVVRRDVPFFNLKVPHFYKLQGYKPHSEHNASSGYVPVKRVRSLRTGAEDEVIRLPADQGPQAQEPMVDTDVEDDDAAVTATLPMTAATTVVTTAGGSGSEVTKRDLIPVDSSHQAVSLTPPDALFKSIEYPSLQIMNPAPGLQVFQAPMPYAEVDYDYHLCPLPKYPRSDHATNKHAATQKRFLDREDTIRGIMSWKKFPSQGLTSLSNTPTLTNVWVPRWDDCFSQELLPEDVPALFHHLPPDDAENCLEDDDAGEEGGSVCLKPEMVSAQFTLIDPSSPSEDQKTPAEEETNEEEVEEEISSEEELDEDMFPYGNRMPHTNIPVGAHGPVAREKREEELEYFMTKKYNRLGAKVKTKISSLNALVSDPDMVLK